MRLTISAAFGLVAACTPVLTVPALADTCGASAWAALIGGPVLALPPASAGQTRRIIRPGDSVTEEFFDRRINYHLDATDRVVRITCG